MTCRSCAERRRKLQREKLRKAEEGRKVQAAALGAVLAVTEVAGKILGVEDERNERDRQDSEGAEPDR